MYIAFVVGLDYGGFWQNGAPPAEVEGRWYGTEYFFSFAAVSSEPIGRGLARQSLFLKMQKKTHFFLQKQSKTLVRFSPFYQKKSNKNNKQNI